jgi:hypothetical protein
MRHLCPKGEHMVSGFERDPSRRNPDQLPQQSDQPSSPANKSQDVAPLNMEVRVVQLDECVISFDPNTGILVNDYDDSRKMNVKNGRAVTKASFQLLKQVKAEGHVVKGFIVSSKGGSTDWTSSEFDADVKTYVDPELGVNPYLALIGELKNKPVATVNVPLLMKIFLNLLNGGLGWGLKLKEVRDLEEANKFIADSQNTK